jgi:hypothetical protein
MRVRRRPKTPAWVNIINMPQIVVGPKLKVIASEIITVHRANVFVIVRLVPMHGMLMLAEVKLRMVASLVAIRELVGFAVKGVWHIRVAATTPFSVDFEDDIVAYPSATWTIGPPSNRSPFPVVFVANVLFEIDTIVDALLRERDKMSACLPREMGEDWSVSQSTPWGLTQSLSAHFLAAKYVGMSANGSPGTLWYHTFAPR